MIGTTEPSSPAAWPVSVRYPGSPADGAVSGSCPGGGAGLALGPRRPGRDRCRSYAPSPSVITFTAGREKRWSTRPGTGRVDQLPSACRQPATRMARLPTEPWAALQSVASRSLSTEYNAISAVRRGNLVAQTAGSRRAELDVLRPVTPAANGPANALDLPVTARTRRDGPACRSTGRSAVAAVRSAARTGLHVRSRRRCPASPAQARVVRPPPGQVLL